MLNCLKLCATSVADQRGIEMEHLVMDGGSKDGTAWWLKQYAQIISVSEKDHGMYDALNKGTSKSSGDILACLNCDVQYLPGTLAFAGEYFACHPKVDVLFGYVLLIDPEGKLIAFRNGYQPRWPYIITSHLYVLSSAMFFRRKLIVQGLQFDSTLRDVSGPDFVIKALR